MQLATTIALEPTNVYRTSVTETEGGPKAIMFFTFPENAHWNAELQTVEFGVEIGEYRGVVRVPRRVFQRLLPERSTRAVYGSLLPEANPV